MIKICMTLGRSFQWTKMFFFFLRFGIYFLNKSGYYQVLILFHGAVLWGKEIYSSGFISMVPSYTTLRVKYIPATLLGQYNE